MGGQTDVLVPKENRTELNGGKTCLVLKKIVFWFPNLRTPQNHWWSFSINTDSLTPASLGFPQDTFSTSLIG